MSPYCQIQAAVTQTSVPPYVLVEGSATPYNPVSLNTTVKAIGPLTIIGPGRGATPGATLAGSGAVTPNGFTLLTGAGNAAMVSLEGLTLIGAGGATPGAGARCTVGVGAATLSIVDSKIQMSGGAGVISRVDCGWYRGGSIRVGEGRRPRRHQIRGAQRGGVVGG